MSMEPKTSPKTFNLHVLAWCLVDS